MPKNHQNQPTSSTNMEFFMPLLGAISCCYPNMLESCVCSLWSVLNFRQKTLKNLLENQARIGDRRICDLKNNYKRLECLIKLIVAPKTCVFVSDKEGEAGFCSALSMEPDAARNEISRLNVEPFY